MANEKSTTKAKGDATEAKPKVQRKIRTLDERIAELEAKRQAKAEKEKAKKVDRYNLVVAKVEALQGQLGELERERNELSAELGLTEVTERVDAEG